jgi:hypothetical protein
VSGGSEEPLKKKQRTVSFVEGKGLCLEKARPSRRRKIKLSPDQVRDMEWTVIEECEVLFNSLKPECL